MVQQCRGQLHCSLHRHACKPSKVSIAYDGCQKCCGEVYACKVQRIAGGPAVQRPAPLLSPQARLQAKQSYHDLCNLSEVLRRGVCLEGATDSRWSSSAEASSAALSTGMPASKAKSASPRLLVRSAAERCMPVRGRGEQVVQQCRGQLCCSLHWHACKLSQVSITCVTCQKCCEVCLKAADYSRWSSSAEASSAALSTGTPASKAKLP